MKFLYSIKQALVYLFSYPVNHLEHFEVDYDAYWEDKRGEHLGKLSRWQKQRADLILSVLKETRTSVVLIDIGCADGAVLRYLKDNANVSRIIGADVSSSALVKARAHGVETILVGQDLQASVEVIPKADYILLLEVLEHMPDAERFLNEMLTKSSIGVFFSFPNTGYFLHRLRLLLGRFPLQWRLHPSEHLRFWTYRDLKWWLTALGHTQYTIHAYEGVPILNTLLPSIFGKGLFVYIPKRQA